LVGGKVIHSTYTHQFKSRDKELVSERMIFEVGKSIEVAYELSPLLDHMVLMWRFMLILTQT
jgi:hypothetical protein